MSGTTTTQATTWSAVSRPKTYELVLQRIEEQILAGHLRVGDRLPAERELATQLAVSRSSIREAVRILEARGVVVSQVGTGPEAGTVVSAMPAEALSQVIRLHLALASFDLAELIEARITLERSSVRLTALGATDEDLVALQGLLAAMDAADLTREQFNDLDTAFHVAVARASHNRLVSDVTVALRTGLRGYIHEAFEQVDDWAAVRGHLVTDHAAILAAVRARDPDAAADLVEAHIRDFAQRLLPADGSDQKSR